MSKPLYSISDRDLLRSAVDFQGGFLHPAAVLEGLSEEQATAKPCGAPHSIAEIVAHMHYWQEYFIRIAKDGEAEYPERAEIGWPPVPAETWPELRDRFLASIEAAKEIASTSARLDERLLPEDFPLPFWDRESVGSGLLHGAIHGAHHLGQIVTLRQIMQLWPPPQGGVTW